MLFLSMYVLFYAKYFIDTASYLFKCIWHAEMSSHRVPVQLPFYELGGSFCWASGMCGKSSPADYVKETGFRDVCKKD